MYRFWALACCFALLAANAPSPPRAHDRAAAEIAQLRAHVKHVFVIYQENRSFDSYFGTFPGAENLASPDARTHGFRQYDAIGRQWVTPYRITDPDISDADHARPALLGKMDGGRMDRFIEQQEKTMLAHGDSRVSAQRLGLLTMAFEDCDTVPFLWKYARSFSLYDRFFQGMTGPSTPGNLEIIAAQTGQTQWARHPAQADPHSDTGRGEPVVDDLDPAFGPYRKGTPPKRTEYDQRYANVLLTLSGKNAVDAKNDAGGIRDDVAALAKQGHSAIPWGWYQEGFNGNTPHVNSPIYATHHDAPQYFGYVRRNRYFWRGVHNFRDVLPAIRNGTLGDRGVVFIKGGYGNSLGWKPANPDPSVQKNFTGDDDHPGYADSQLSESFAATVINAIARSKYWKSSAIFIIWDDSEGYYDHVSPPQFERCPDGHPCGDGPRVPAILISPYAKSGGIISDTSDHASFVKFLGTLFDLPALASLPDEKRYLPEGPRDANPRLSNLVGGFDPRRLSGAVPPIPASAAEIPDAIVDHFPARMSCSSLGIRPVRIPGENHRPKGYAPRRH